MPLLVRKRKNKTTIMKYDFVGLWEVSHRKLKTCWIMVGLAGCVVFSLQVVTWDEKRAVSLR